LKLNKSFKLNEVGGEAMLLDTRSSNVNLSKVFRLSSSAAWLWKKIADNDVDENILVQWICSEYEVGEEEARQDVKSLLDVWKNHGIIS